MKKSDLASEVSTPHIYKWTNGEKLPFNKIPTKKFIAVIDLGVKENILRTLNSFKYEIIVFPLSHSIKDILSLNPSGIFLSNGPGDPLATYEKHSKSFDTIKEFKNLFLEFV